MTNPQGNRFEAKNKLLKCIRQKKVTIPIASIGIVIGTIVLAITLTTIVKNNKQSHEIRGNVKRSTTNSKALQQLSGSVLADSIHVEEVMSYLNELQRIATDNSGTRAINTPGFNATLDYITNYLTANTNYKVTMDFFFVRDFALASDPILVSSINGATRNYTYSNDLPKAEFSYVKYSTPVSFMNYVELTVVPNVGCSDEDWQNAHPPAEGRVALVKRGTCAFREKGALSAKYNVAALLLYNDGATPDRMAPIVINLGQDNAIPALFLSFTTGQRLVNAAQDTSTKAAVRLVINTKDLPDFPVGNICADTPTGDVTQTIVIGSHSDSVPSGPGINDNGKSN